MKKINLKFGLKAKIIGLNVVNFLLVTLILFLLSRFDNIASEVKELRNKSIAAQETTNVAITKAEIEANRDKVAIISDQFVNEEKVINFAERIDELKREGVVTEFSILADEPVLDTAKNLGLPIMIKLEGDPNQVDAALNRIQALPYLVRPVMFDIESLKDENRLKVEYGGFLYVGD